jgi:hypothetical protein
MKHVPWTTVAHAFRRTALPLASYYAVTLAVPLANGAAQSGAFVEHALAVLIVPPVAIILACTVHTITHALAGTHLTQITLGGMVASLMTFPEHGIVVSVTSNISYADTFGVGVKIAQAFVEQGSTPARK